MWSELGYYSSIVALCRNFKYYHSHQREINLKEYIFWFSCNSSLTSLFFFLLFLLFSFTVNNFYFFGIQSLQLIFKSATIFLHFFYLEFMHFIPRDFLLCTGFFWNSVRFCLWLSKICPFTGNLNRK